MQSQQNEDKEEHDHHKRDAVTRALKADVATLFAQARRATAVRSSTATATAASIARDSLHVSHNGDGQRDEGQQTREDDDGAVQHNDDEAALERRVAVSRALKADVASLFARAKRTSITSYANASGHEDADHQSRSAVTKADVAALFASVRRAKTSADNRNATMQSQQDKD